ncbi:hypothetical protein BX666DRAFT_101412 [Dichotomocladium elegans]|nr:hypothetical protein BX666DRAFT_101412 [Dichotomocladium elegans]
MICGSVVLSDRTIQGVLPGTTEAMSGIWRVFDPEAMLLSCRGASKRTGIEEQFSNRIREQPGGGRKQRLHVANSETTGPQGRNRPFIHFTV